MQYIILKGEEYVLLFSKDALNWSKVMIQIFILLQNINISDKCCSSELSIHQRNLKSLLRYWEVNQNITMISE